MTTSNAEVPTDHEPKSTEFPTKPSNKSHPSILPSSGDGTTVNSLIFKSVVKIFVVRCSPNYSRPWQMSSQTHSSSTGFIISLLGSKHILCNAHGVTFASSIRIRKHGDSKKYDASIEHIGHECDLAILRVDNNKFWRNLNSLQFDYKTPALQDIVVVVGYPIGGDNICVTKGVVSRVGFVSYSHALENLFSLQIDAAINAGNSGGPTIMNNKVVGVAFETHLNSQNIGYCIPIRVVMHFLDDIKHHNIYTNFPKLGFRWQKIENPSLKKYLQMVEDDYDPNSADSDDENDTKDENNKGKNGILINSVYPLTDCHDKLYENDVLLSIDGINVGEDGTIKYPFSEDGVSRINYTYITSNKFCGDKCNLKILRNGKILFVDIIVDIIDYLVPIVLYNTPSPQYYIFGGFVFLPLSRPYLRAEYGSKWSSKCNVKLKDLYFNGHKKETNQQVVILSRVLASDLNVGFHKFTNCVLKKCQGNEIKNLKQLINIIQNSTENKDKFVHFLFEHNVNMVLEIDIAVKGSPKIMKEHKIKFDRSADLRNDKNDNEKIIKKKNNNKKKYIKKKSIKNDNINYDNNRAMQ
eukprot:139580_1